MGTARRRGDRRHVAGVASDDPDPERNRRGSDRRRRESLMIVVFGSINVDLVATVHRLPRAGETLIGRSLSMSPGGKGANQALAARRAGARVALYGAVGSDAFADPALALLRSDGVDVANVQR